MRIKLHFPQESIDALRKIGLRQSNPETLRLVVNHPQSSYGIGVLLRGKSGDIFDGHSFLALQHFGARILVDSAETKRKVENALVTAATELDDAIQIAP